jgi:hypothetical protein
VIVARPLLHDLSHCREPMQRSPAYTLSGAKWGLPGALPVETPIIEVNEVHVRDGMQLYVSSAHFLSARPTRLF